MKHNLKVVFALVGLFFLAQLIGLYIVDSLQDEELPYGIQRPQLEKNTSFIHIFTVIIIVTLIFLLLARFNAVRLWKFWFFIAIVFVLTVSLSAFTNQYIAIVLALIAAVFKIIKPNIVVHNLSELFVYGGMAAIFVPVLSLFSISVLIILIALYDMVAVWKTKHMIKLAKFQSKLKMFTGLLVPYDKNKVAILGGGDIGFPLLFAGVALGMFGILSLIIPIITSFSLFLLLYFGRKDKFYPAMPFLGAGCFIGYLLIVLL